MTESEFRRLLLDTPMSKWDGIISDMWKGDKKELRDKCTSMVQHSAMLASYLDARGATGYSDQGHIQAARESNKMVVKIRRIFGFAYPEKGTISF